LELPLLNLLKRTPAQSAERSFGGLDLGAYKGRQARKPVPRFRSLTAPLRVKEVQSGGDY
jgi:hypothetical protein